MSEGRKRKSKVNPGDQFGRLTVVEFVPGIYGRSRQRRIVCKCSCGVQKDYQIGNILSGKTKSCGCLRMDTEYRHSVALPFGVANSRHVYSVYSTGAKKRGLDFELTFNEFLDITKKDCYYCGEPPSNIANVLYSSGPMKGMSKSNGAFVYSGIDRMNNKIGYMKGNCVPCCSWCNTCKSDRTIQEFSSWIHRVYFHFLGEEYEAVTACEDFPISEETNEEKERIRLEIRETYDMIRCADLAAKETFGDSIQLRIGSNGMLEIIPQDAA